MKQTVLLQRLEGAVVLAGSVWLYQAGSNSFWLLLLLILVPDITMLGYAHSRRLGALTYNLGHSYLIPGFISLGFLTAGSTIPPLLLIWFAHIGLDRMLGYGLKENTGFQDTHLGKIGQDH